MIDRLAPLALRLQFAAAILAYIGLGGISAWVGSATLTQALRLSAAHVPLIEFRPLYVTGLPVAMAFLGLTVMALLPKRIAAQSSAKWHVGPAHFVFGVVICNLLLATIIPSLASFSMAEVMRNRGYRACPVPDVERHPPMRWVDDDGRCP